MINGDTLTRKLAESKRLQKLLDAGQKPAQVVDVVYMTCLSRKPGPDTRRASCS